MRARISAEIVSGHNKHALHFILKVKPQDGDWLKGEQYNDYPVPADLGSGKEIEYATGVYFHPGNYTLALIAFESNGSRISVAHRDVRVEAVKDDPFPEIGGLLQAFLLGPLVRHRGPQLFDEMAAHGLADRACRQWASE